MILPTFLHSKGGEGGGGGGLIKSSYESREIKYYMRCLSQAERWAAFFLSYLRKSVRDKKNIFLNVI